MPEVDDKGLRGLYLAEWKGLRDEMAATNVRLNSSFTVAITTTAAIVGVTASMGLVPAALALAVSAILTALLLVKALHQQKDEGPGALYLQLVSDKLSGSRSLRDVPLNWETALKDTSFLAEVKPKPHHNWNGYRFAGGWIALLIIQILGTLGCIIIWVWRAAGCHFICF